MKFILAKKIGMSQIFEEDGTVVPITVVSAEPMKVTQIKITEKDGYEATQFGSGSKKKISKPLQGHFKELGSLRHLKEVRGKAELKKGDIVCSKK